MGLFGFAKKEETAKSGGCCGGSCTAENIKDAENIKYSGGIKVLGGGCAKCHELVANTQAALKEMGVNETVELITDFAVIAAYGVMSTPALVIDSKVVAYGKILKRDEIIKLFKDTAKRALR